MILACWAIEREKKVSIIFLKSWIDRNRFFFFFFSKCRFSLIDTSIFSFIMISRYGPNVMLTHLIDLIEFEEILCSGEFTTNAICSYFTYLFFIVTNVIVVGEVHPCA